MRRLTAAMAMVVGLGLGWWVPGALAITAYKDAQENVYFEGLETDLKERRYSIYYYGPSTRYESVWMYPEEPSRAACDVHVIFRGAKFTLTDRMTLVAAPGGDLNITRFQIPTAPFDANPCTLPNAAWKTLRGTIQATRLTQSRFPYTWVPKSGPDAGKRITSYQETEMIYFRGLPGGAYLIKNQYPKIRFSWANECGFMKLANTSKWPALTTDQFDLSHYKTGETIATYTRASLPIRPWQQIPKCFGGKRFMYQP